MHIYDETESIGIACFVKTPAHSPIKTRLSQSIGEEHAINIYQLMVECMKDILKRINKQDTHCHPYWAVAEENNSNLNMWKSFPILFQKEGSLGNRLYTIYSELLRRHTKALLIGSDSPFLSVSLFEKAIFHLRAGSDFVLGPSEDGGFYLFGGSQALSQNIWNKPTYSANTTLSELKQIIQPLGRPIELTPHFDIDTISDLEKASHLSQESLEFDSQKHLLKHIQLVLQNYSVDTK